MTGPRFYVMTRRYEAAEEHRQVQATIAYSATEAVASLLASAYGGVSIGPARPPMTREDWEAVADYVSGLREPDVATLHAAAGPLSERLVNALELRGRSRLAQDVAYYAGEQP